MRFYPLTITPTVNTWTKFTQSEIAVIGHFSAPGDNAGTVYIRSAREADNGQELTPGASTGDLPIEDISDIEVKTTVTGDKVLFTGMRS